MRKPYFNSTNFVVLDVKCNILTNCLRKHNLSSTQYCILLKCAEIDDTEISMQEISRALDLRQGILTQSVDILEEKNLLSRSVSPHDGREKLIHITQDGLRFLDTTEPELYEMMVDGFDKERAIHKQTFMQRGLRACGKAGARWSPEFVDRYPTSTNVASGTVFRRLVIDALQEALDLSLTEVRILQRLEEVGQPLRIKALSEQIYLTTTTITRACAKLEKKGFVKKLASPDDLKAVYIAPTEEGEKVQTEISEILATMGEELYWGCFSTEDLEAAGKISRIYLYEISQQEAEAEKRKISKLVPILS